MDFNNLTIAKKCLDVIIVAFVVPNPSQTLMFDASDVCDTV